MLLLRTWAVYDTMRQNCGLYAVAVSDFLSQRLSDFGISPTYLGRRKQLLVGNRANVLKTIENNASNQCL